MVTTTPTGTTPTRNKPSTNRKITTQQDLAQAAAPKGFVLNNGLVTTLENPPQSEALTLTGREPPFHNSPTHTTFNNPYERYSNSRLFRGYIREYFDLNDPQRPKDISRWYQLDFLYNPNALSVQYTINQDATYNPVFQDPQSLQVFAPNMPGAQISFDLFFERGGIPDSNHPDLATPEGVLRDVRILDKILTRGLGGPGKFMYGYMSKVRVRFSRHGGGVQPPLNYIGFIQGVSLTYTRFNIDMVPTRAQVGVTMLAVVDDPELDSQVHDGPGGNVGYTIQRLGGLDAALNPQSLFGQEWIYTTGRAARGTYNIFSNGVNGPDPAAFPPLGTRTSARSPKKAFR